MSQTRYPFPTKGANSANASDYELLTYDPSSNVTQRRLRDGQLINFTYDNLNRVTLKDVPNIVAGEFDVTYGYDLLGRLTSMTNASSMPTTLNYANCTQQYHRFTPPNRQELSYRATSGVKQLEVCCNFGFPNLPVVRKLGVPRLASKTIVKKSTQFLHKQ